MRRRALAVGAALAGLVIIASCGARTGLDVPIREDASVKSHLDATIDAHKAHDATMDHAPDVPIPQDGRMLDVIDECATPTYCKQDDPNYIYKCGERIFQCGSLEQCEVRCPDGGTPGDSGPDAGGCKAECINPCLDTLGQNTSNGCEFYPVEMDTTDETVGVCYAVFVVNQWTTGEPAKLTIDNPGFPTPQLSDFVRIPSGTGQNIQYNAFNPEVGLPQGEIAILFLSRETSQATNPNLGATDPAVLANCPPGVTPFTIHDAALHGTGIGTAFHLRSNVPVVAYQMLPYGGGSARVTGATLLLPTNVWRTNYLGANAYARPVLLVGDGGIDAAAIGEERAGPNMVVIASADDTHVTIDPVTRIVAGPGVAGTGANEPITYTLNQGQYLQFTQLLELSGSPIQSDKPVAVIAGSTLMDIPVTQEMRADHGEQMIPPVQALGNEYVGVRYRTRSPPIEESTPWRLIGAVDGTVLTFDPPQPGAPTALSAHQLAEFDATGPFVVTSQDNAHPFYFAQYMTGGFNFSGVGDPEYVNVVPPAQYLPRYTFFTDPTYPETNLVVVRRLDAPSGLFPDVTLDCAGKLSGWAPVGSSGTYQFTRIDLSTGNFQGQNGCNNGVHTIKGSFASEAGVEAGSGTPYFGVTVWGWGNTVTDPLPDTLEAGPLMGENAPNFTRWVSYAYPAGSNFAKLNDVVVPAQ